MSVMRYINFFLKRLLLYINNHHFCLAPVYFFCQLTQLVEHAHADLGQMKLVQLVEHSRENSEYNFYRSKKVRTYPF